MKKIIFAVVVLSLLTSVPAFAEETKKEELSPQSLFATGTGGGSSMSSMDKPAVMPVPNGIIVISGNKLLKYDADLNLVREVEIPTSLDGKKSPLMGKTTEKTTEKKESVPAATESQEKTI